MTVKMCSIWNSKHVDFYNDTVLYKMQIFDKNAIEIEIND